MAGDVVALADDAAPDADAEALLRPVMRAGRLLEPLPTLASVRARCAAQLAALPAGVRRLRGAASYVVRFSDRLVALQRAVERDVASPALHQPLTAIR
jgi:nicotinate phosphoribosyltransferase